MPILYQTSLFELDTGEPGWRRTYGVPRVWAPDGLDWFAAYPAPRGGGFDLEGYKEPPVLDKDRDAIEIEDAEVHRLIDYAHWYLSFKEGVKEGLDNTKDLMHNLMRAAALRNAWLRRSALYREYMGEQRDEHQAPARYPVDKTGVRTKGGGQ